MYLSLQYDIDARITMITIVELIDTYITSHAQHFYMCVERTLKNHSQQISSTYHRITSCKHCAVHQTSSVYQFNMM